MTTAGHATVDGTRTRATRTGQPQGRNSDFGGLTLSSIGLGTYLGAADAVTDRIYEAAISRALELGCNLIDTSINYRCQRSERAIGRVLAAGSFPRDEIIIGSKAGYIPYDGDAPADPAAYIRRTYVATGLIDPKDVVAGSHCLSPEFLTHQIGQSLANLGLSCLDVYYLHNPETQLEELPADRFYDRMRAAFATLEEAVERGRIRRYGIATWNGLRASPTAAGLVSLERLTQTARNIAGDSHHFRVVQLPFSLAMPEAYTRANQSVGGVAMTALAAAAALDLYVVGSAALYQTRLAHNLPEMIRREIPGLETDAQRAIQFARSTPGVGSVLVGMKQVAHVEENLHVLSVPPLELDALERLIVR